MDAQHLMPSAFHSPCSHPGCPERTKKRFCDRHYKMYIGRQDAERGTSSQRGYGATWRKLRTMVLSGEPLCRQCGTAATEVDHIVPLRLGGTNKIGNLQALCKRCHSRKTAEETFREHKII